MVGMFPLAMMMLMMHGDAIIERRSHASSKNSSLFSIMYNMDTQVCMVAGRDEAISSIMGIQADMHQQGCN